MTLIRDPNWLADLDRYPPRPFVAELSIWAVWMYRLGRMLYARRDRKFGRIALKFYWLPNRLIEAVVGITLPISSDIGPGLRIWHFGGIVVHPDAVIGRNCTLRQGVTIGNRHPSGPVPRIGNNVEFGAYAQVLGGVRVGDNCKIGALSVVLRDVPDGATAVGIPARIVRRTDS